MNKEELKKAMEEKRTSVSECPGAPSEGACEFCFGPCSTTFVDGRELTEEEEGFIYEVMMAEEDELYDKKVAGEITEEEYYELLYGFEDADNMVVVEKDTRG